MLLDVPEPGGFSGSEGGRMNCVTSNQPITKIRTNHWGPLELGSRRSDSACSKVSLIREERKVGANKQPPFRTSQYELGILETFAEGGPLEGNERLNLLY